MMKDMISDTQYHNIKVSTFTFRTKEETIQTTIKVQNAEEFIRANNFYIHCLTTM